ncbi:MAG: polyprenyl synthetase family protein [Anaerolineaceae bacterium]|nr:polyprenyl synthetase family protein [Anaerolineaceae bacterium]
MNQKPSYYQIVQKDIRSVEQLIVESIQLERPDVDLLLKKLFTSGGKRIRPNIALLLGKIFDADMKRIITLSAAIEMLHTATLVHDDLIDNAIFRRGNTTLNAIWTPAATVLAGDYLFARAAEHAANTNSLKVMKLFSQTLAIIVRGEITQFIEKNNALNLEAYYKRIFAKTASLFQTTTSAVGIISDLPIDQQNSLENLGHQVGMAFQIIDDILDYVGNQDTLGKPIGSDLRNNIITLPAIIHFQHNKTDFNRFKKFSKAEDKSSLDDIVKNIVSGSAIENSLSKAKGFIQQSCSILDTFPQNEYTDGLKSLVQGSLTRIL